MLAATAFAVWPHLGRMGSEAAPSGNLVWHRINRGGDRRLNNALRMAVAARMRMDPSSRDYVQRRTAKGRTLREIRPCLRRYLPPFEAGPLTKSSFGP